MKNWGWATMISALIVALPLIAVAVIKKGDVSFQFLFSVLIVVILAGFAAVVLGKMLTNDINLQYLISEDNGNASLSRFQFLVFTFVIAASYFLFVAALIAKPEALVAQNGSPIPLPDIPSGVLGLIGISGASYVIAKGIQKSASASAVVRIHVTNGGAGYTAAPSVTIAGGGGTGAQATAVVAAGIVDHIDVTSPGADYSSTPTVQLAGGGGTGATAVAELG
jgi:hypothetical protein